MSEVEYFGFFIFSVFFQIRRHQKLTDSGPTQSCPFFSSTHHIGIPLQFPTMQLTLPDCCLGETCSGIHLEDHKLKDDVSTNRSRVSSGIEDTLAFALQGTIYSKDDLEGHAYHYHNTCVLPLTD